MAETYLDLTEIQTELLSSIAFGHAVTPLERTARILEEKGLIMGQDVVQLTPVGEMHFTVWEMPIGEHIKFCEWCATQVGDD